MIKIRPSQAFAAICLAFTLITAPAFANEGHGGETKAKDGPLYVDFKNITVPVIKKNGQTGIIALSLSAQVKDVENQSKVVDRMPKIRDAFIRTLYGNLETNQLTMADGALDIPQIKERLLKVANLVLKDQDKPIEDLLFQNIAQQTY